VTQPPPPPPPSPYGPDGPDPAGGQPPPSSSYRQQYGEAYGPPPTAPYGQAPYGQNPYGTGSWSPGPSGGRPQSKAMGGWALGLAIAFCVPLATLVSIGLAIATLVTSRDGRDRGRGMAIAALVIDGLLVLGLVALVVVALLAPTEPQRDTQGRVTERHEISTFDIREGDCVDDPALMAAGEEEIEVQQAEAVPCGQAHDLEAYRVFDLDGEDYPGRRLVVRRATLGCLEAFEGFVGRNYRSSEAEFWTYYPQQRSWDLLDDRTVVCLVGIPDEKTSGTLEDSRR
jgi:hypothetical protein